MGEFQPPSRDDFIKMATDARNATAEALADAERAGSRYLVKRYEDELAVWDGLIERLMGR